MNILILTGRFGMGHWAASLSLRQQLLSGFPDAQIEIEDFPAYAMPNASVALYKSFNLLVAYGSGLFNTYYRLTSLGRPDARPPLEGLFLDKLAELLQQRRPDAVIATHPLCAQMVSRLKEEAEHREKRTLDLPLITCITDVSSHPEWINRNTDCYLVPSEEVRESLVRKGVEPARVCVTGIPVREEFHKLNCGSKSGTDAPCASRRQGVFADCTSGRRKEAFSDSAFGWQGGVSADCTSGRLEEAFSDSAFGWQEGVSADCTSGRREEVFAEETSVPAGKRARHELLIMGGGLGLLPSTKDFYETLNEIPDTHVTIITGRNRKLYRRLAGKWDNIQVIGYTERVWEYMERADMIVTKPGGITLFESIYAQVPIYTWRPALCQEKGNARWLEKKGIGWVAGQEDCAEEIREILLDRQRLARAAACMSLLREQFETERLNRLMAAVARSGRAAA